MRSSRVWAALSLTGALFGGVACGDDATDDGGAGSGTIPPSDAASDGGGTSEHIITATNSSEFDVASLEVPAGEVTVTFDNQEANVAHNVHFRGIGDEPATEIITGPDTADVTFTADAGEYEYLCDVHPNMTGTLTVTE